MHNCWGAPDAVTYELQKVMFLKNLARVLVDSLFNRNDGKPKKEKA
jgi:hypothetical protein